MEVNDQLEIYNMQKNMEEIKQFIYNIDLTVLLKLEETLTKEMPDEAVNKLINKMLDPKENYDYSFIEIIKFVQNICSDYTLEEINLLTKYLELLQQAEQYNNLSCVREYIDKYIELCGKVISQDGKAYNDYIKLYDTVISDGNQKVFAT